MFRERPEGLPGESLAAYDYELPEELIAQEPMARRDASRLLILDRQEGALRHCQFEEIVDQFRAGDLIVLNETRVFPARLRARRASGGRIEILLLAARGGGPAWTALARPARNLRSGEEVAVEPVEAANGVRAVAVGREAERVVVEFRKGSRPLGPDEVFNLCEALGETPLPPYIRRDAGERRNREDRERYQTVYASRVGSTAAPTAGLHFTREILDHAEKAGVSIARLTLHVGLGTFQPLNEESLAKPTLHEEEVEVGKEAGEAILEARRDGRRIIAVGTTSVRAIESFLASEVVPFRGPTRLFIKPGYTFRGVSALLTNFHLPRSSLLVLLCAFAGRERILEAYKVAVKERYRFFSYGDAMLVL